MTIETTILKNLIFNQDYTRRVLPYIKKDYFANSAEGLLFELIEGFVIKYNNIPTTEALKIDASQKHNHPKVLEEITDSVDKAQTDWLKDKTLTTPVDPEWLIDETEKWCQERAIYCSVRETLEILENKKSNQDKGIIPKLLSDALGVSFDNHIGHDYFEDIEQRFEYYHKKEAKFPFDIEYLNRITKGGVARKTLNVISAGTNVGKSLILCHLAANYISQGFDVLYITLEMAEEEIAKRIDANLYNMALDDVVEMPHDLYVKKIEKIKTKTHGNLIIKEYPTAAAHSIHFRNLFNELNLKKKFTPTIVMVDYINICASSRIKPGGQANMYTYIKSIAEELRGLAVEFNVPLWTATQLNRTGYTSSDPGMEHTAESFGLPATADFWIIVVTNEELEELEQYMFIQAKNRYNNVTKNKRAIVGVDRDKMKLYNVEDSAQTLVDNNGETTINDKSEKFKSLKV